MEAGSAMLEDMGSDQETVVLAALGCTVDGLPKVDRIGFQRTPEEVRGRCLALFGVVASSHGLDRRVASDWLVEAGVAQHLTEEEASSLSSAAKSTLSFDAVEALWVLAWALGLTPALDWAHPCSDSFVRLFPDPLAGEDASEFCAVPRLRSGEELNVERQVAFELHNCWVNSRLMGGAVPSSVDEGAVRWRRHALEWLALAANWADVPLDT